MEGSFGKFLMLAGVVMVLVGLVLQYVPSVPLLGKLPGDLQIQRGGFRFYFPLGSCLLISVVLTLLLQLFARLR